MSKEIDDLGAALQQDSQPAAPMPPHGEAIGPQAPPEPEAPEARPAAPAPDVAQPGGSVPAPRAKAAASEAAAVQAHLTGEPDALPPTWCKKCQAEVKPEGKGRCPRCQTFLRLNFARRKHPINVLRRQQIREQLLQQFPPADILERTTCERMAGTMEQLEVMKAGSPDWQRLVQTEQTLSASLRDARLLREARTPRDLSHLTNDEMRAHAQATIDRAQKMIDLLRPADPEPKIPACPDKADTEIVEPGATSRPVSEPEPAPEPICGYGCGTLARCAELKTTRPDAWAVLHYADPQEVKKRDEHATKVMLKMMPFGNPY